jgi:predicted amidohydrolase
LATASNAPTGVGGSLVTSPLGDVLATAGDDPQLLVCDINLEGLRAIRDTLPVLRNRSEFLHTGKAESPR